MKKNLLSLLLVQAALTPGLSPVFGQSVWHEVPALSLSTPTNTPYGAISSLTSPQANMGWGTYLMYTVNNFARNPYVFFTANDWATVSTGGPQFIYSPTNNFSNNSFSDLAALDGQTAWLCGTSVIVAGRGPVPTLSKTNSGVQGFAVLSTALPAAFKKIHFFTATTGVAICDAPAGATAWQIYRTTDAGLTWTALAATPAVAASAGVSLHDRISVPATPSNLWVKTDAGMLHTTDAGLTWAAVPNLKWVAFSDAVSGLAVQGTGNSQQLLSTADGGTTWATMVATGLPVINTLTAVPGQSGMYISGGYTLPANPSTTPVVSQTAITRDQGATWQVISTDNILFKEIVAYSPTQIWAQAATTGQPLSGPQRSLLRLGATVLGTRQPLDPALRAEVYPNPTTGVLQLKGPLRGEEELRVYDAAGRLCQVANVSETRRTIDLSTQRSGLYQLVLTSAKGSVRSLKVSKTD